MSRPINATIKRLYVSLKRLEIHNFLITEEFKNILIEKGVDDFWNDIEKSVIRESGVLVAIPTYTGYALETLHILLSEILKKDNKLFVNILDEILVGLSRTTSHRS